MNRDIICLLRILMDSLPPFIRNSYWLFYIIRFIFNDSKYLYKFRDDFNQNPSIDLSKFYLNNKYSSPRSSANSDINSFHLRLLYKTIRENNISSLIDIGCGDGFFLKQVNQKYSTLNLYGIDYNAPHLMLNPNISFIKDDISNVLPMIPDNRFDVVTCSHVLEHLRDFDQTVYHLRRISKKLLILICPLEKKFKWGFNYHINFFPSQHLFLYQVRKNARNKTFKSYMRLGDLLYIEYH